MKRAVPITPMAIVIIQIRLLMMFAAIIFFMLFCSFFELLDTVVQHVDDVAMLFNDGRQGLDGFQDALVKFEVLDLPLDNSCF
jgi:hypothetical protein